MPGGFVFRLEAVRKLRLREEQQQQRALAEAVAALVKEQSALDAIRDSMRQQRDSVRLDQQADALDIMTMRARYFYLSRLEGRAAAAGQRLEACESRVAREREELARRSARRKALDKLRERRWTEYRMQLDRKAQAEQDEMGAAAYLREQRAQAL